MSQVDFAKFVKNRLASLVSYANAGTDLTSNQVQAAITELANRNFGKNFAFNVNTATTSVSGTTIITLATVSPTSLPSGNYLALGFASLQKSLLAGQIETWIQVGATQYNRREISMDDDDFYYGGSNIAILNLSGNQTINFNAQKVNGGGNMLAQNRTLVFWRLN